MDSSESQESTVKAKKRKFHSVIIRCLFALCFSLLIVLSVSYGVAFLAFFFGSFSISPPISVPSQCKIVASSVDLRSSKICELGLLNYKAKRVFYPSERRKFRCHYDYYWASIFKVEYQDHFSGDTLLGLAEIPNEALPSDCRPNFGSVWSTKHMLKVNETYDCWYTSGRSKVKISRDSDFGCQAKDPSAYFFFGAKDPSAYEMMKRYSILSSKMMQTWFSGQLKSKHVWWEVAGVAAGGFFSGVISMLLLTICGRLLFSLGRVVAAKIVPLVHRMIFSRIFFLVAYFSIVGWVTIQYGKRLGLVELFVDY